MQPLNTVQKPAIMKSCRELNLHFRASQCFSSVCLKLCLLTLEWGFKLVFISWFVLRHPHGQHFLSMLPGSDAVTTNSYLSEGKEVEIKANQTPLLRR